MRWGTGKKPNPKPGDYAWCVKLALVPRHTSDLKWVWLEKYLVHYKWEFNYYLGGHSWHVQNRYSQDSKEWFDKVLTEEERQRKEFIRKSLEELHDE